MLCGGSLQFSLPNLATPSQAHSEASFLDGPDPVKLSIKVSYPRGLVWLKLHAFSTCHSRAPKVLQLVVSALLVAESSQDLQYWVRLTLSSQIWLHFNHILHFYFFIEKTEHFVVNGDKSPFDFPGVELRVSERRWNWYIGASVIAIWHQETRLTVALMPASFQSPELAGRAFWCTKETLLSFQLHSYSSFLSSVNNNDRLTEAPLNLWIYLFTCLVLGFGSQCGKLLDCLWYPILTSQAHSLAHFPYPWCWVPDPS